MTNAGKWHGNYVRRARAQLLASTQWPTQCAKCGRTVQDDDRWVVGHIKDRATHPELAHDPSNWQVECRPCSDGSRRLRTVRGEPRPVFSGGPTTSRPRPDISLNDLASPVEPPEWAPEVPICPRIESPVPGNAVGSYGEALRDFVRGLGEDLLPWQAYVASRALEHDESGALVHRRVGVSVCRQVGKSMFLRFLAWWRLHCEALFGEPQTILHVAHSLNTVEEVFQPALVLAKRLGFRTREANGQQRIEVGESRWLPRSTQTGYGFTLSLALVDEAWAVDERRVNSGYAPTLSARRSGQVWLFSSANEESTTLFPRFRETRRDGWLLLEWSAPPASDVFDRDVWQAACPVPIDGTRAALMADELAANETTFGYERLNRWPRHAGRSWGAVVAAGLPEATEAMWGGKRLIGGLESDPGGRSFGVAVSDGARVETARVERLSEAVLWLRAREPVRVLCHETVGRQLQDADGLAVAKVSVNESRAAAAVLRDRSPSLAWSGPLAEQLRHCEVSLAGGGVEQIDAIRSQGPVAVVKAAAWALWSARAEPHIEPQIWVSSR